MQHRYCTSCSAKWYFEHLVHIFKGVQLVQLCSKQLSCEFCGEHVGVFLSEGKHDFGCFPGSDWGFALTVSCPTPTHHPPGPPLPWLHNIATPSMCSINSVYPSSSNHASTPKLCLVSRTYAQLTRPTVLITVKWVGHATGTYITSVCRYKKVSAAVAVAG